MHLTSPRPPLASPAGWQPPLLVKASIAAHAGAAALAVAQPALWPTALGVLVLNHGLLAATGLWPRSTWLGPNMRRLPAAAAARGEFSLTLDDGPDPEVTPVVLDLLDQHQARATFFCIASQAAQHPSLCREIVRRGHSVQNHSQHHAANFSLLGPRGFRRELGESQDSLAQITGQQPRFFRAPAGLRNPFLDRELHALGLQLVSWTRRGFDTVQRNPARVLAKLSQDLDAGDIVLLHDRNSTRAGSGAPVVLEVLPRLLQRIDQAGLRCVTLPEAVPGQEALA